VAAYVHLILAEAAVTARKSLDGQQPAFEKVAAEIGARAVTQFRDNGNAPEGGPTIAAFKTG
jgi:hypothetical protein